VGCEAIVRMIGVVSGKEETYGESAG
jgi:hypothetical protein